MPFRAIFVAIVIAGALIVGAFLLHEQRPEEHLSQPSQEFIRATGKCAECHQRETSAVVHEFQRSAHAVKGITCLDCHKPMDGQEEMEHRGFVISKDLTAKNCQQCHSAEYRQFVRSRHGAPAWAAVTGKQDFTQEQIQLAEKYHPGAVDRPPNKLAQLEGPAAMSKGCMGCHQIGKPNQDGSIGSCTDCHSRHNASIQLARTPERAGNVIWDPTMPSLKFTTNRSMGCSTMLKKSTLT